MESHDLYNQDTKAPRRWRNNLRPSPRKREPNVKISSEQNQKCLEGLHSQRIDSAQKMVHHGGPVNFRPLCATDQLSHFQPGRNSPYR